MSYPLYPQIDPQEVAQAHQFNVTHQSQDKSPHNFANQSATVSSSYTQNNPYQTHTFVPTHQFVSGNSTYAPPSQSHQPQSQYYYYQPQHVNAYPSNTQIPQYVQQPVPTQTSFPHLYAPQNTLPTQPSYVQTAMPAQTHPPVTSNTTAHPIASHVHQQEPSKPVQIAHPQQLSDEEKEEEDAEEETTSSIITTDRKLARLLSRIERTLKRLQISIMKRNRTGTARSKELLENYITEIQSYHIVDVEERSQVNMLIQRIQLSIKHAEEELELMEQDRQHQLAQYRNAVMELKKEAQQAQQLLESDLDQQTQDIINQVHQQQHQT